MSPRPQTILSTMHLSKRYSFFPIQTEKRIARNKIESPVSNANIVTENPVRILYAANSAFGNSAFGDSAFGDSAIGDSAVGDFSFGHAAIVPET
ncbi:hypothetical protein L6164_002118 [Bauhinia variegata]|uniref:Uncharacterized protein n=1 Tax=Bauhinia variegata TaxID=167791 RepID=A0ACB9PXC3_BAUVA|nr:hypothetical protein L6164_002118 [Bauhinia variegata]